MPRCRSLLLLSAALLAGGGAPSGSAEAQPPKVADTIEQRLLACAACHGKQGEGTRRNDYYPRLAGKPAGYLYNQMKDFRERRRESSVMTYMVGRLSDAYLAEIADYYSRLHPPYPAPASGGPKERVARGEVLVTAGDIPSGVPACVACHGKALMGLEPAIPGLVGLDPHYVSAQLGAWRVGQRRARAPDCMREIATRLSTDDIAAVTAWLSTQAASPDVPPAAAGSVKLPIACGSAP